MLSDNTTKYNKGIVRRAVEALRRGDIDGYMADAADDIVFTVIGTVQGFCGEIHGKERLIKGIK